MSIDPGEQGYSVLIVDDNPENLRVLGNMLREHGYRVRVASGGAQALRSMEAAPPDLLLLDIHMPEIDGYDVCRQVKASPELSDIPVVFISALGETFNKVLAYDCGGADYITKPFQFEEVHARMRAHLRARRLLAEVQAGFRSSFEQAAVGMAHIALDGRFLRVNRQLHEMLGHKDESLLECSLADILRPDEQNDEAACRASLSEGRSDRAVCERQLVKRDGSLLWCRTTLSLVNVGANGDQYLTLIAENISTQKQAEEELRSTVTRHRSFLMNLPVGACLCTLDQENRYSLVNPALAEMLGYASTDDLLEHGAGLPFHHPGQRDALFDEMNQTGHVEGYPLWLEKQDGTPLLVHLWGRIGFDADIAYLEAVLIDVTEQQRSEEERRRLAAAIEQAAEAVIITDAEGRIQYINSAAESILGWTRDDVTGEILSTTKSGITSPETYSEILHALSRNQVWSGRFESRSEDGSTHTQEATVSPVRDRMGKVVNYVAVARDITEETSLEGRLRQAQKMEAIGTLAGGIAHDFNNILSAIIGHTDLALQDVEKGGPVWESLTEVARAGERARDLVAQILAFSRQTEREVCPIRVQTIIKEAMKLLRGSIPSTIEIRQEVDAACSPVLADPTGIHQILMNLCTNAYHAMRDKGGTLLVRLGQVEIDEDEASRDADLTPGSYIRMEVHDTGHGMDSATRSRIFEPYFTTKERGEGTGLGLATIHGIVKDLHGTIHVYSEPGAGSVFTLLLPCAPVQEGKNDVPPSDSAGLHGNERVLLVDDEEPIGNFVEKSLTRMGYRVTVYDSSRAALAHFREHANDYDVVVTDQMMPEMKGSELSREVDAIRPGIPVIMCSGFGEALRGQRVGGPEVKAHVMKPIIGADLARAIRKLMDGAGN